MRLNGWIRAFVVVMVGALGLPGPGGTAAGAELSAANKIHDYRPGMKMRDLAGKSDADLIRLRKGSQMTVGDIKRLGEKARRIKASKARVPGMLKMRSGTINVLKADAGNIRRVNSRLDLAVALQQRGGTIEFSNGKRVPVELLRELQPYVEKRIGRKLVAAEARNVIKVSEKSDWKAVFSKPDDTVLESPEGHLITLGQLKEEMRLRRGQQGKTPPAAKPVKVPGSR